MSAALGLDALVDARRRLRERRSERDKQVRTAESGRREWYRNVEALDDERARTCAQAIGTPKVGSWDLDAVELVLEGAIEPEGEGEIALLRGLAALSVPSVEQVQAVAAGLRTTAEAARAAEQTDAGRARQIADLLQGSLALHAAHGDRPCPVCGSGELTLAWRSRTEAEVRRLRAEAEAAHRAGQALADARRDAQTLLSAPPNTLRQATPPGVDVHALLNAARTLMAKLALALFDDAGRTGEVLGRINRSDHGWADTVRWANSGAHGAADAAGDLPRMVRATERLSRWLSKRP